MLFVRARTRDPATRRALGKKKYYFFVKNDLVIATQDRFSLGSSIIRSLAGVTLPSVAASRVCSRPRDSRIGLVLGDFPALKALLSPVSAHLIRSTVQFESLPSGSNL